MIADIASSPVPVALLDTNILHFLDLYTKRAKKCEWYPFGEATHDAHPDSKSLTDAYGKGKAVMRYVLDNNIQIQYSPVSELELLKGRLRGQALLKAAEEGIPDRMWSKFREKEVGQRLTPPDFCKVHRGIDDFIMILREDLNVEAVVIRDESMSEVWSIARELAKLVFLDTNDCLIYASALTVGAKYLITDDGYLREKVEAIRQSSKTGHGAHVRKLLAKISPVDTGTALPEAKRPNAL